MSDNIKINNNDYIVIFMHIPKTAGSTMRTIISNQYQPNEIYLNYNYKGVVHGKINNHTKCIEGHDYFGVHEDLGKNYTYITILRDPIDRVISEYYYIFRFGAHDPYIGKLIKEKNMCLEDYIDSQDKNFLLRTNNMQTRYSAGGILDIEKAKYNLIHFFTVVGITERFDESLRLMKERLNWKDISYYRREVNDQRAKIEEIPDRIINKIKNKNLLDIELYNWANKLLDKQIKNR